MPTQNLSIEMQASENECVKVNTAIVENMLLTTIKDSIGVASPEQYALFSLEDTIVTNSILNISHFRVLRFSSFQWHS